MKSPSSLVSRTLVGTVVACGALIFGSGMALAKPPMIRAASRAVVATNQAGEICDEGFRPAVGGGCIDIDECAEGTGVCGEHQICVNRMGTFTCSCEDGYERSGKGCLLEGAPDGTTGASARSNAPAGGDGIMSGGGVEGGCDSDHDADGAGGSGGGDADVEDATGGHGGASGDEESSDDDDHTIVVHTTEGLCAASPTGGANPSMVATLLAVGAVLASRRRQV